MNGFDIALLVVTGLAVMLGLVKGLTRLLIGTGALIVAFMLAAQFHQLVATKLSWIAAPDDVLKLIAYLVIFFGTIVAGGILGWFLRKLLKVAMLGWADRLAGGAVGLIAATLIAALIVLPVVAYSPLGESALRESTLAPYVTVVADVGRRLVPRELSDNYKRKVEDLRQYWRERLQNAPEQEVRRLSTGDHA